MIKRKAFFISGTRLTNITREKEELVIFDLNNGDTVTRVETICVKDMHDSTEKLLLFLQRKHVRLVYVSEMDDETKSLFQKYGIQVKTLQEQECDWLCNTLYLSPPSF
ncbi:MAG: hypothetical protein WC914_08485 [Proteiniphilum sp.]